MSFSPEGGVPELEAGPSRAPVKTAVMGAGELEGRAWLRLGTWRGADAYLGRQHKQRARVEGTKGHRSARLVFWNHGVRYGWRVAEGFEEAGPLQRGPVGVSRGKRGDGALLHSLHRG